MAFNQKKQFDALKKRTGDYAKLVSQRFSTAANSLLALQQEYSLGEDDMFTFADNPKVGKKAQDILRQLHSSVYAAITKGVKLEWDEANKAMDAFVASKFGKKALNDPNFVGWVSRNTDAMQAFLKRTDSGMNLSQRVWKYTKQLQDEMEMAITVSVGEGKSASQISREVRQYLQHPDKLFRRVRDKEGNLKLSKAAKAYHPGQGVYRSSAKNAMRLARTETNMAYRSADFERWQQLDFVTGIRIELSHNHPEVDICDTLQGVYPKDFKFTGWHPNCFCHAIPVTIKDDDFVKMQQAFLAGEDYDVSSQMIENTPKGFVTWAKENKERILDAKKGGTLPYFVRDNWEVVKNAFMERPAVYIQAMGLLKEFEGVSANTADLQKALEASDWEKASQEYQALAQEKNRIISEAEALKKEFAGIMDVDEGLIAEALKSGKLSAIQAEADKIQAIKRQEQAMMDLIPNAHDLHKSHSLSDLQVAHDELDGVMKKWLAKYNYSSLDAAPLDHLRNKLDFELQRPTISYTHKDIVDKAIREKIILIDKKKEWDNLVAKVAPLRSFKTKSAVYKDLVEKVEIAIKTNDFDKLKKAIGKAEAKMTELIEKQLKRGGDIKTALNKQYKGGAIGTDLTETFDVKELAATDWYEGEARFTNDIARLQGFDAPAKLVSETEFATLETACGDVFYRTVNPTTFNGKNMTSAEFAMQMYTADKMGMNGPSGRVYGDGIYVATSAWDGRTIHKLDDARKNHGYRASVCYGNGEHTISEMTWARKPKIIKERELWKLWNALGGEEQARFGYHMNTYGCALGYDAMYTTRDYMVIWNRSIIAVKKVEVAAP